MFVSSFNSNPIRANSTPPPAPPAEDPGQVYVTGEGFVQNFGQVESANGTLRLYDSGVAHVLAKDIVLKDGIRIHDETATATVTIERPDGAKIAFEDSALKLPYEEKGDHSYFEIRSHRDTNPMGFVEDVFANGEWKVTHYNYDAGGKRQEQELAWKGLSLDQRWAQMQTFANASNSQNR